MALKQWVVTAVGVVVISACSAGGEALSGDDNLGTTRQAVGETITADKANYTVGENVVLTWTNFPGNYYDWIGLTPVGSPPEQYVRYAYAFGQVNGTVTLVGPPAGDYIAYAFSDNSNTVIAQTGQLHIAAQNVATTISTSAVSYQPSQSAIVNFTGMAGYATDWISLAPPGSPATEVTRWTYTGGQLSGSVQIPLVGLSGTFVARALFNNGYTVAAESAQFTVGAVGTSVTTDSNNYAFGANVQITYANMQGTYYDWIGIAAQGAPDTDTSYWEYTKGQLGGTINLSTLPQGTFVARAFFNDSFTKQAESAPFTVGAPGALPVTVTTDKAAYLGTERVVVNFTGMQGNNTDWVGAYRTQDAMQSFTTWAYTGGQVNGLINLYALPLGTYEVRAFFNDGFVMQGKSAGTFTVATAIQTDLATYTTADVIHVSFGGNVPYVKDWIAIAPQGSQPTVFNAYQYTYGYAGGTLDFNASQMGPGTYVARSYWNDEFTVRVESAPFVIQ